MIIGKEEQLSAFAYLTTLYLTWVDPVKPTLSTLGCVARDWPNAPLPVTTLKTPKR